MYEGGYLQDRTQQMLNFGTSMISENVVNR